MLDVNIGKALVYPLAEELLRRHVPFVFHTGAQRAALPPQWSVHPFVLKPSHKASLARALDASTAHPNDSATLKTHIVSVASDGRRDKDAMETLSIGA